MKYFTLRDFFQSAVAVRYGIDNRTKDPAVLAAIHTLCEVLDEAREAFGHPVKVSSGYRCEALNRLVGGSVTSQHLTGEAADVVPVTGDIRQLAAVIMQGKFDQLILEQSDRQTLKPNWLHVSVKADGRQRQQVLIKYRGTKSYERCSSEWVKDFKEKYL